MNTVQPTWTPVRMGIVATTLITALIHLALGFPYRDTFGVLFLLNGLGYLALLAGLFFLPQFARWRTLIRWALMGYAALTIVLWLVMNGDFTSPVGVFTKLVELALIVLLFLDRE